MSTAARLALAAAIGLFAATAQAQEYRLYFGNLHAHTSVSDGKLMPADAYDYARNTAHLDFMTLTDHVEQITADEWTGEKQAADAATEDGKFVAAAAYEWGSPVYDHLNFFDIDVFYTIDAYVTADLGNLWHQVRTTNPPPIMQFNHPDPKPKDDAPKWNWKQFQYDADIDKVAALIEVKDPGQEQSYMQALDNGWHVSAAWNQDNHDADWGTENDCRTALWMTELTRKALYEAMRAGRSYATCDKNASVTFKGNGEWMGSIVTAQPVRLTWDLSDPDATDTFDKIEVITNGGTVLDTTEPKTNTVTGSFDVPELTVKNAWFYLRITVAGGAPDGGIAANAMIQTAPIYYEEIPDAGVADAAAGADAGTGDVLLTGAEPGESSGCSCAVLGLGE